MLVPDDSAPELDQSGSQSVQQISEMDIEAIELNVIAKKVSLPPIEIGLTPGMQVKQHEGYSSLMTDLLDTWRINCSCWLCRFHHNWRTATRKRPFHNTIE